MSNAQCQMTDADNAASKTAVSIIRVREGLRLPAAGTSAGAGECQKQPCDRIFSVILSRPLADDEDMSIIATAADPKKKIAIPPADTPHPDAPDFIARPPMIFAIGLRQHGGAMVKKATRLYNVRVRYIRQQATGNGQQGLPRQNGLAAKTGAEQCQS